MSTGSGLTLELIGVTSGYQTEGGKSLASEFLSSKYFGHGGEGCLESSSLCPLLCQLNARSHLSIFIEYFLLQEIAGYQKLSL